MKRFFQLKNIAILLLLVAVLLMALLGEKFYDRMIREGMTSSDSDSSSVSGNVNVADYTNKIGRAHV